jgi:uncharacterized membrane protein
MARKVSNVELVLGIILILLGALMLVGAFTMPWLAEAVGVALVAVGTFLLVKRRLTIPAVAANTLGVVLLVADAFEDLGQTVDQVVGVVVGTLTLMLGVLVIVVGLRPRKRPADDGAQPADADA